MRRLSTRGVLASAVLLLVTVPFAPARAVVGGGPVDDGALPFMASIQHAGTEGSEGHFCGGSVVASRWVLTAAHCVVDTAPGQIQVSVGRTHLDKEPKTAQTLGVDRIVVHPRYGKTGTFDAALVHVTAPITSASIDLVDVGDDAFEADGAALEVAGWGVELFGSPFASPELKSADLRAVADRRCTTNRVMGFQAESEVCAEELLGDSCQGDSGGPLFGRRGQGRFVQVGIVSYGLGCATPGFPGVYAEVNNSSIRGFVTSTTGSGVQQERERTKGPKKR